jgi:hypothetical protein
MEKSVLLQVLSEKYYLYQRERWNLRKLWFQIKKDHLLEEMAILQGKEHALLDVAQSFDISKDEMEMKAFEWSLDDKYYKEGSVI